MFFFEIVSFLIVWPLVWWLGGRMARDDKTIDAPRTPDSPPDNVVDLKAWKARQASRQRLSTIGSRSKR